MSNSPVGHFFKERGGNVATMYALMAPVLLFAGAAAIDYGRAAQIHSKLSGLADAAALAAVTPNMLQQSDSVAQAAATSLFTGLANGISGLAPGATTVTVTVTTGADPLERNVTVNYSTAVNMIFWRVLAISSLPMSGRSSARAQIPPNLDFYVLLDNSPSMVLPATQAGINQMENLTPKQDGGNGCAFACHQASTNNGDSAGNPCANGTAPTSERKYANGVAPEQRDLLQNLKSRRANRQLWPRPEQQHHLAPG